MSELLRQKKRWPVDNMASSILAVVSVSAVLLLLLILAFLIIQAWPALNPSSLLKFFSSEGWHPLEGQLGLLPMFYATLAVGVGALLLALPFALGCALLSLYFGNAFSARMLDLMISTLAGIPSVVFGLWGLTVLVPLLNQWHAPGTSLLAAMIILALMILPTIAMTARAALASLPLTYQHTAASLVLSRATTITQILIPAAMPGIRQGVLLALARAFGETMAVLMVAGNVVQMPTSLFAPVRVLTANIALEMSYATDQHRAALFVSGLLLMLLVGLVLGLASFTSNNGHE